MNHRALGVCRRKGLGGLWRGWREGEARLVAKSWDWEARRKRGRGGAGWAAAGGKEWTDTWPCGVRQWERMGRSTMRADGGADRKPGGRGSSASLLVVLSERVLDNASVLVDLGSRSEACGCCG